MNTPIRIALMSDLHIEFEAPHWERIRAAVRRGDSSAAEALRVRAEIRAEPGHPDQGPDLRSLKALGVDLLLLPGDIDVGTGGIAYADAAARYLGAPSLTCAGNHEAYRGDLSWLIPALANAAGRTAGRVTFLERSREDIEISGRRIAVLGATLWTDYALNGNAPMAELAAGRALNDHRLIGSDGGPFTPAKARALHLETREWLAREAVRAREEVDTVIVMTHHAPVPDANPPECRGELSPAFASDMRREILEWQPDLWVWGHTHFSMRDRLGRTELVSAQRGYIGREPGAERFSPAVITI